MADFKLFTIPQGKTTPNTTWYPLFFPKLTFSFGVRIVPAMFSNPGIIYGIAYNVGWVAFDRLYLSYKTEGGKLKFYANIDFSDGRKVSSEIPINKEINVRDTMTFSIVAYPEFYVFQVDESSTDVLQIAKKDYMRPFYGYKILPKLFSPATQRVDLYVID